MNKLNDNFTPLGKKFPANNDSGKTPKWHHPEDPWLLARNWYATKLGQLMLACEKQCLDQVLEQLFGINLVQLGTLGKLNLADNSRTRRQFVFESVANVDQVSTKSSVINNFEQLAIESDSIDVVLMPHTLEFEKNSHQILREVERILVGEGKIVILGFNPFSLWGVWHKFQQIKFLVSKKQVPLPSCGHMISQKRTIDWLQLLGFDVDITHNYFYRPPVQNSRLLSTLEFMEKAARHNWPMPAGGYVLVATKRLSTLTPLRQKWKLSKPLISTDIVEPTAGFKHPLT